MTVYSRLALNFDTTRFGTAQTLSQSASNTLNLIANTTPLTAWQKTNLAAGPAVRSNYFQNPTASNVANMLISASTLAASANLANDSLTSTLSTNLTIELNNFKSHTDNISGLTVSFSPGIPSLGAAQSVGQLNMMTLAKTDGVTNTAPILGSFTSLFISDTLQANTVQLQYYANEYANSIITVTDPDSGNTTTSSNLSPTEITKIQNYVISTTNVLYNQRMQDWTFYQNSLQVSQDVSFLQQFNSMGGTMSYLVNNVVGTPSLVTKLASNN
jgi:hypothetical protein